MTTEINSTSVRDEGKPALQRTIRAACSNCHDRKVRCDANRRGFPCSNCINLKRPHCRKHEKKKRFARHANQLVPIRQKATSKGLVPTQDSNASSSTEPLSKEIGGHLSSYAQVPDNGANPRLVEYASQKDISQRSLLRGVRITYVGKDVSNINFLVRQRNTEGNDTGNHVATDEIVGRFINHNPDGIPREAFILPDRDLSDQLVEAYFTHVNPGCPLVDEQVFMERYTLNRTEPPSLLLLQAILLVGAHVSRDLPDRETLKATFFRRAKMLYDSRLEKNRDLIIQAALLLTWHSDGPDDTEANAWFWVGIAARTAMGVGLHRYQGSYKYAHIDMRTWKRTFWILYQTDVVVSLFYGRPQAINLDECDVSPLDPKADFEGCGPNVQIDYLIQKTELCILISKVIRERFGLRISQEDRNAALGNADKALAKWNLALPSSLQHTSNITIWTASLHLTYNNFLIILHRPRPNAPTEEVENGSNDSDICSSAANAISTIFEELRRKDLLKYVWVSDINALFTTMVQISVELRFSNPILAINALRRFDSSLSSLRKLVEYWPNAAWILAIFEESSQVQHGIRLGNPDIDQSEPLSRGEEPIPLLTGETDRNSGHEINQDAFNQADSNQNYQIGQGDWEDPISQALPISPDFMMSNDDLTGILPLENEWREIYWEEPGISESFADGLWGWQ